MSFEIVLPDGTTDVASSDVPLLIVKALNPDLNAGLQRAIAEDHEGPMRAAIANGSLRAVNPTSRLPDSLSRRALIPVEDLRRYVAQFDIAVRIATAQPPARLLEARQACDEVERAQEASRKAQGRYRLEEAAERIAAATGADAKRMQDKLLRAAYFGDLPVYEPGHPDRYTYASNPRMAQLAADLHWIPGYGEGVRTFYEEASWNELNAWLAKSETQISWRFPEPAEQTIGWFDASMAAAHWLVMDDVTPDEAAQLLCRLNPLDKLDPETTYVDGDREWTARYRLLKRVFEDVARGSSGPRTLRKWRDVAREKRLQCHPWFDEYLSAITESPSESAAANEKPATVGIGRRQVLAVDWPLRTRFTQESLGRALSDVPEWIKPARTNPGKRGVRSATWNPALLAECLATRRYAEKRGLASFLQRSFPDYFDYWQRLQGLE